MSREGGRPGQTALSGGVGGEVGEGGVRGASGQVAVVCAEGPKHPLTELGRWPRAAEWRAGPRAACVYHVGQVTFSTAGAVLVTLDLSWASLVTLLLCSLCWPVFERWEVLTDDSLFPPVNRVWSLHPDSWDLRSGPLRAQVPGLSQSAWSP